MIAGAWAARSRGLAVGWQTAELPRLSTLIVARELCCPHYLRDSDDFALFGHSKSELWSHKRRIVDRLVCLRLRLRAHESSAHVCHTRHGVP